MIAFRMALVKIYVAGNSTQAHFVRQLLEAEGVAATVLGDQLTLVLGSIPMTRGTLPAVWVSDELAPRAREVIARFNSGDLRREASSAGPWTCSQCGERIEGQFTHCWNCGSERPADTQVAANERAPEEMTSIPTNLPCARCEYNLRGLHPAGRCPECAAPIFSSLLMLRRRVSYDERDETEELLRSAIAPAAARAGHPPQAVLFVLDAWLRALDAARAPAGELGVEPPQQLRRAFATRVCRSIVHRAVAEFGGAEQAVRVLGDWNLGTCQSIAAVIFAMAADGFIEPPTNLTPDDFADGSIELLLPP